MKAELKAKFLQHLNQKNQDKGFTLIELLVVIIIIGILSAIALPSFLSQTSKARQSEAKNNLGAVNRSQQAYYLENQSFTDNLSVLGLGITNSDNYNYSVAANTGNSVTALAISPKADLKEYSGGVFKNPTDTTTATILCEGKAATDTAVAPTDADTCDATTMTEVK